MATKKAKKTKKPTNRIFVVRSGKSSWDTFQVFTQRPKVTKTITQTTVDDKVTKTTDEDVYYDGGGNSTEVCSAGGKKVFGDLKTDVIYEFTLTPVGSPE